MHAQHMYIYMKRRKRKIKPRQGSVYSLCVGGVYQVLRHTVIDTRFWGVISSDARF